MISDDERTVATPLPVADGLFAETDEGPRLVGSACGVCGTHYFPAAAACRNPDCAGADTDPALLGPDGVVYSLTVLHYPPPPAYSPPAGVTPYTVALVDLPGRVRVAGIVDADAGAVRIGDTVRVAIDVIRDDAQGMPRQTWMFRPVAEVAR